MQRDEMTIKPPWKNFQIIVGVMRSLETCMAVEFKTVFEWSRSTAMSF